MTSDVGKMNETKSRSELSDIFYHLVRDPLGLVGLIIVGLIVFSVNQLILAFKGGEHSLI